MLGDWPCCCLPRAPPGCKRLLHTHSGSWAPTFPTPCLQTALQRGGKVQRTAAMGLARARRSCLEHAQRHPTAQSPPRPHVHLVWWLQEHNPAAADVRQPRSCRACVSTRVCAPPQAQPLHGLKHPLFGWEPEPNPRTAGHWWSHGMCAGAGHQCLVQCCCSAAWRCRAAVLRSSLLVVSFLAS